MKLTRQFVVLSAVGAATLSPATILTFDIAGASAGQTMPMDYGDFVTSGTMGNYSYGISNGLTPDVNVDYGPHDLNFWTTGYSDLTNVLENEPDGDAGYDVIFTPNLPGQTVVTIESFDMGNWGGAIVVPGITIRTNSGVLWQQNNIELGASASPHLTFTPNVSASERIYLHVDTTGLGGNSDNVGLDNIAFRQSAVPEPATMAALGLGFAAIMRRRRKG